MRSSAYDGLEGDPRLRRQRSHAGQLTSQDAWADQRDAMELSRRDFINAARRESLGARESVSDVPVARPCCYGENGRVQVGESWAYRAWQTDELVQAIVVRFGAQQPARFRG
jgi:hypothetical protein